MGNPSAHFAGILLPSVAAVRRSPLTPLCGGTTRPLMKSSFPRPCWMNTCLMWWWTASTRYVRLLCLCSPVPGKWNEWVALETSCRVNPSNVRYKFICHLELPVTWYKEYSQHCDFARATCSDDVKNAGSTLVKENLRHWTSVYVLHSGLWASLLLTTFKLFIYKKTFDIFHRFYLKGDYMILLYTNTSTEGLAGVLRSYIGGYWRGLEFVTSWLGVHWVKS